MNAALLIMTTCSVVTLMANPDAKRLYDDLLSNYNRLIRPVSNNSDTVTVRMGLRLSQLIDLDLKNQILTTNVWVEHVWEDSKLNWDPEEYGGVTQLIVPSEHIWLPDIVLYNNADGDYVVTTMTKAILHFDGRVEWSPPAIFKSYCEIDVQYFPFDSQTCFMKFGSWSHSGYQIDLRHINQEFNRSLVEIGIDLRNYYPSVEWDILSVPAEKHNKFYPSLTEPYPDIFFNITLRRKTLFYTVNLIFPCVGISCLSVLVFYLPADSGEKVALCISILLSQTMFFLLISEIIPSTSLAVPLLGKYLLFTMFLVGLSVLITIVILNMHYRKPSTHKMAAWVRRIFIHRLPKILLMRVPKRVNEEVEQRMQFIARRRLNSHDGRRWSRRINYGSQLLCEIINFNNLPPPPSPPPPPPPPPPVPPNLREGVLRRRKRYPFELQKAIRDIHFIQNHMKRQDEYDAEDHDWNFVAMVLDRLFLWIFTLASLIGTVTILLEAPALYDPTTPIDMQISVVAQKLREDTEF